MHASFDDANAYRKFSKYLRSPKGNYYFFDAQQKRFIKKVRESAKERIVLFTSDHIFFRAKKGFTWGEESEREPPICYPLNPADMTPSGFPNRANAAGKFVFYGSSDANTALSEIREWIDAVVTVGSYKPKKNLRIVLCNSLDKEQQRKHNWQHFNFEYFASKGREIDKADIDQHVWNEISLAFSLPVQRGDSLADYVPTQILSELFRSMNYDGIAYKSSVAGGMNIAIFNPDLMERVDAEVHVISSLAVQSRKLDLYGQQVEDSDE